MMFCQCPITVTLQAVAFLYFSLLFIIVAGSRAMTDSQRQNGKAMLLYAMLAAIMVIMPDLFSGSQVCMKPST